MRRSGLSLASMESMTRRRGRQSRRPEYWSTTRTGRWLDLLPAFLLFSRHFPAFRAGSSVVQAMAKHQKPTPVRGKARVSERISKSPVAVAPQPARPPTAPLPPPGPAPEAVSLFQQGMELLQQHQYGPA